MQKLSSAVIVALLAAIVGSSQVRFPLEIDEKDKSFANVSLFCDAKWNCGLTPDEQSKLTEFGRAKVLIEVRRTGNDFHVRVDSNGDKNLKDEGEVLIKKGAAVIVRILRDIGAGKTQHFPYEIAHRRSERNGVALDAFSIASHYVGATSFKHKDCSLRLKLVDLDHDGRFSVSDANHGTNLGIDRNNDGRFFGKDEYRTTSEIIDFCGQNFLISSIDNSFVELTPTELVIAKLGDSVPAFSLTLIGGQTTGSNALKGKSYLLDFWASWCTPCVENLPAVTAIKQQYQGKLVVISVNVDGPEASGKAREIIDRYRLNEFSVVRGLGEADPLWKTFGGANLNRLAIPLYVLVDEKGIVRYADNGGNDLSVLKEQLTKHLRN